MFSRFFTAIIVVVLLAVAPIASLSGSTSHPSGGETLLLTLEGPAEAVECYVEGAAEVAGPFELEEGSVDLEFDKEFFAGQAPIVYFIDATGAILFIEMIE